MSKPATADKIEALEIILRLIKDYDAYDTSDGTLVAMEAYIRKLERERERLLNPAPKVSRKQEAKQAANAVAGEPIAAYHVNTDNLKRRGRNG